MRLPIRSALLLLCFPIAAACSLVADVDATTKEYGRSPAGGGASGNAGSTSGGAGEGGTSAGGNTGGAGASAGNGGNGASAGNGGNGASAGNGGNGASAGNGGNGASAGNGGKAGSADAGGKAGSAGVGGSAGGKAGAAGTSQTGGGSGSASCALPVDCPAPPICRRAICVNMVCALEPVAAGTACADDGNLCNGAEQCDAAGLCQSVGPLPTNDGDACTLDECRSSDGVITHNPIDPNDGDACTVDACDPKTGPTHAPVPPTESCVLSLGTCAQGFHVESLTKCSAGEPACDCATTTAYRQACAPDCGTTRTVCTPASAPTCPAGFHRTSPLSCCGGDCATYLTSTCKQDTTEAAFPTCESACPGGFHPIEILVGAPSGCASTTPPDSGRRLTCEANSNNFTQCGTTCPEGYSPKNTSTAAECGAGAPNRIRCQK